MAPNDDTPVTDDTPIDQAKFQLFVKKDWDCRAWGESKGTQAAFKRACLKYETGDLKPHAKLAIQQRLPESLRDEFQPGQQPHKRDCIYVRNAWEGGSVDSASLTIIAIVALREPEHFIDHNPNPDNSQRKRRKAQAETPPIGAGADALQAGDRSAPGQLPNAGAMDTARPRATPYPGLVAFQRADADIFFGRDDDTRRVLERMRDHPPMTLIIGDSGSGKSSLARAGVLGWLASGRAEGLFADCRDWGVGDMLPSPDPFLQLAFALNKAGAEGVNPVESAEQLRGDDGPAHFAALLGQVRSHRPQCLLLIDQMEELFSAACAPHRAGFLDLLQQVLRPEPLPGLRVLATVRIDFYAALTAHPLTASLLGTDAQPVVRPPGIDQLRDMISLPLQHSTLLGVPGGAWASSRRWWSGCCKTPCTRRAG